MWVIALQKVDCFTSRLSAAWFAHLVWHKLLWFAEYCGYEDLIDVRRALNIIRETGRIRNDLAIDPVSVASIVANRQSLYVSFNLHCRLHFSWRICNKYIQWFARHWENLCKEKFMKEKKDQRETCRRSVIRNLLANRGILIAEIVDNCEIKI